MKSAVFMILVLITAIPAMSHDDIPFTIDITGKPYRSYEETRGDYNYQDNYVCDTVYISEHKGLRDLVLYVNAGLYPQIESKLVNDYIDYMESVNWTVVVKTISGGDESNLRNTMISDFDTLGYFYAIFIGDLPVAWFDVEGDKAEGEFPCDLFYMDLDGEWRDDQYSDGIYDYHGDGTGDMEADIPLGRWTVSPLTFGGNTEKTLIEGYIDKNLDYRTGGMVPDEGGLAYVDDDWAPWASEWGDAVSCAFSDVLTLSGPYVEEDDYEETRLPTSYQHMLVCVHSGPYVHTWNGSWTYTTYNTELYDIESHSVSYNLFACSNARYTEANYMCGWYAFMDNEWGIVCLGSTKTGSMLNFEDFYVPLGCGETYGEAFREWFEINGEHGVSDARAWFYGMSLHGDPTLRTYEYVAVKLAYLKAEAVNDGVVLSWEYSDEGEDVGFNLYRRELATSGTSLKPINTEEIKINDEIITGSSPLTYFDAAVKGEREYEYRLEMITNGNSTDELTAQVTTLPPVKTCVEIGNPYPNPSNRVVNFQYYVAGDNDGKLGIYDISGRVVFESEIRNNNGLLTWDIDDNRGTEISDGVYFVKLSSGDEIDIKKFVISR